MRAFLGSHLDAIQQTHETVETEGKSIKVYGPLSDVYTAALQEELKKEDNLQTAQESFTDPEVIAKLIINEARNAEGTENPLSVYAFNRATLSEKSVIDAALAATQVTDPDDFYVVNDYTRETVKGNTPMRSTAEITYLEKAMESLVEHLGAHYITEGARLKYIFESRDGH